MARLAAYYQEEFHYAPTGYGTSKQRKAAYIAYGDEPKNNLFNGGYLDHRHRLSNLALSDPALSPTYSPHVTTTIRRRSPYDGHQFVERPQNFQYYYDPQEHYIAQQHDLYLENESVYGRRGSYDVMCDRPRSRSKDKVRKRLVYDDSWTDSEPYHSLGLIENDDRHRVHHQNGYNHRDQAEEVWYRNVTHKSDSSHGRWQQWPWATEETYMNRNMLSPPSPLDSGLSSQSITSSPSLEAEIFPAHLEPMQYSRSNNRNVCLCTRNVYAEFVPPVHHQFRVDSGRSSPGAMSSRSRTSTLVHAKNNINYDRSPVYIETVKHPDQVRYGKLGLLSEPQNNSQALATLPKCPNVTPKSNSTEFPRTRSPFVYNYVDENGIAFKKAPPSRVDDDVKNSKSSTETTDKESLENDKKHASDPDHSDKSPEPESSVSLAVSNSNSSSMSSSNNDLVNGDSKKGSKTTEKEIRELEDMYKKCNLGDRDLMDRAERRDLPTAHQTRVDHSGSPGLTRSKSDTFYEILSASYHNPYHRPPRAPPCRRAGIPDRVADDMALRKQRKNSITSIPRPNDNPITYMLCSSHFTPTVSAGRDILLMDKPDVEYDDFSYRRHYHGRQGKMDDVQPPFGIPLRPPPPQRVFTDYLHVMPNGGLQPLCHPRGNPDVVRDDMAFRTLRKDDPDRVYYDTASLYRKLR